MYFFSKPNAACTWLSVISGLFGGFLPSSTGAGSVKASAMTCFNSRLCIRPPTISAVSRGVRGFLRAHCGMFLTGLSVIANPLGLSYHPVLTGSQTGFKQVFE